LKGWREMKVKELIEQANKKLKDIFERPIVKNSDKGRKVITPYDACKILNTITENKYSFRDQKFDIQLSKADLNFKTKRKKLGIINSWDYSNQMTVTEIYIEDENKLDRDIEELVKEYEELTNKNYNEAEKYRLEKKQKFLNELNKYGMSAKTFIKLASDYKWFDYQTKKEIEEME
jgi:hypothetical protein